MGMKMIGNANTENFVRGNASLIAEHLEENPDGATSRYHRVYKCKDCDKEYDSFQALGGHRASHRKLMKETGAHCSGLQFLEESGPKLHECRICGKGFAIGQALGGHMRKHREMKLDTGQKDSLHNNANAKIWNTTVVEAEEEGFGKEDVEGLRMRVVTPQASVPQIEVLHEHVGTSQVASSIDTP
ncbi:zinc finger protein ZAT6-like [Cynara cardunculus var. scolymus]|uniref:zinc finger protein ZAT6-like n=1 Tax=Cynara cardunculus var. scolymus TaxID=59895 RepID=UPI000D62674C|nr:zinc finger protein ZAT6-like [Cynara cardunculus var. scolymus]